MNPDPILRKLQSGGPSLTKRELVACHVFTTGWPSAPGQLWSPRPMEWVEHRQGRPRRDGALDLASFSHFDLGCIIKTKWGTQFTEEEPETQTCLRLPSFTQLRRGDLWDMVGRSQAQGQSLPLLALCIPSDKADTLILPSKRGTVHMRDGL